MTKLTPNSKRSLSITLKIQTRFYIRDYGETINESENIDAIVDNIFFYWVRNSSYKNYVWTSDFKKLSSFLTDNSDYIKNQIKKIVIKENTKRKLSLMK